MLPLAAVSGLELLKIIKFRVGHSRLLHLQVILSLL
jgi:hypothetical protein